MKVSLVATVLNEEATIGRLLSSLQAQTRPPDEIIICDGGSHDRTVEIIREQAAQGMPVRLLAAPGANIARGRNLAIGAACHEIVACTDAGVRLAPTWLEELVAPFAAAPPGQRPPDVVGGFFEPDAQTVFEVAMGATVLPNVEDIEPAAFLPSSRSVAFTAAAWRAVGGYPEWLDFCEDLVFDIALRRSGCRFAFAPRAVVYFRPRSSLRAFFKQYYQYARGDGKADLWRRRHAIRYATYAAAPLAIAGGLWYNIVWGVVAVAGLSYCWRPYRRLLPRLRGYSLRQRLQALLLVPLIRLTGDVAKMLGYPVGVWWRLSRRRQPAEPPNARAQLP